MLRRNCITSAILALALLSAGCRHGGIPLINLLGINKPVVVALSNSGPIEVLNPFSPYDKLREAISKDIGHDVALDLCQPFQVEPGLNWGVYHLAIVSPQQFAQLNRDGTIEAIAIPVDEHNHIARQGLLIVPADSNIQKVGDVAGKTVGFGPVDDPRTDHAALSFLEAHGVKKSDVAHELLPIPGSLRHYPNANELADALMNHKVDAGFIDSSDWTRFGLVADVDQRSSQKNFRVIGETGSIPEYIVARSPKLDAAMTEHVKRVERSLLEMHRAHPDALKPLNILGFRRPGPEIIADVMHLAPAEPASSGGREKRSENGDEGAK